MGVTMDILENTVTFVCKTFKINHHISKHLQIFQTYIGFSGLRFSVYLTKITFLSIIISQLVKREIMAKIALRFAIQTARRAGTPTEFALVKQVG